VIALTFRAATIDDVPNLLDILGADPSQEQLGMSGGDAARARAFRALMNARLTDVPALAHTTVAVRDGRIVGLMQTGNEIGDRVTFQLMVDVVRVFGFGVFAFARRDRLRARVHLSPPDGAFHIAELHVHRDCRSGGIGAALMAEAEHVARTMRASVMSLTTTTSNPARRLYERCGYTVIATRTDPDYRALTGVDGRVLMLKQLGGWMREKPPTPGMIP
jgi:ribosomal protein S18 acetylase RimI-like enzyme